MRKSLVFSLPLLLFLSLLITAGNNSSFAKPFGSAYIIIAPVEPGLRTEEITKGDVVELQITARSFIEADVMEITTQLAPGLELIEGQKDWVGTVKKSKTVTLRIKVRVIGQGGGKITSRLELLLGGNTLFSDHSTYTLGKHKRKKGEAEPRLRKDRKGRNIIEHQLR